VWLAGAGGGANALPALLAHRHEQRELNHFRCPSDYGGQVTTGLTNQDRARLRVVLMSVSSECHQESDVSAAVTQLRTAGR
jgi:hypothetical protein